MGPSNQSWSLCSPPCTPLPEQEQWPILTASQPVLAFQQASSSVQSLFPSSVLWLKHTFHPSSVLFLLFIMSRMKLMLKESLNHWILNVFSLWSRLEKSILSKGTLENNLMINYEILVTIDSCIVVTYTLLRRIYTGYEASSRLKQNSKTLKTWTGNGRPMRSHWELSRWEDEDMQMSKPNRKVEVSCTGKSTQKHLDKMAMAFSRLGSTNPSVRPKQNPNTQYRRVF